MACSAEIIIVPVRLRGRQESDNCGTKGIIEHDKALELETIK